jgi:hypothetical protein
MQNHVERVSNGRYRSPSWQSVAVMAMTLVLAACGGGGSAPSGNSTGSGSGSVYPPPPPPPPPPARATLAVTVVDAFGFPVPAATVGHYQGSNGVASETDSEGKVTLDVRAGPGHAYAHGIFGRQQTNVDLAPDERVELRLALVPDSNESAFAVLGAEVVAGSVAADGRSLDLRVRIAGGGPSLYWSFEALSCAAREPDALAALGPKCVDKGDGTDRGWQRAGEVEVGELTTAPGMPAGPVLVLLDRSQRAGEVDDPEEHLFAAKLLVANLFDGHPVAVGAFASDGGPSGTASPLPEKPVTYFPVGNPGWISDRDVALEALESLHGVAGGSPALSAAIDSGVDFLLARADASDRPALVVLTAGGSDGCSFDHAPGPGAASQCAAVRAAAERARLAGVALWLIGPSDSWRGASEIAGSPASLISVARESRASWAISAPAYGAGEVVRSALSGAPMFREVRFRISSDEVGSFAPGVEIGGEISIYDAGWGAWLTGLPYRTTVPAAGP